MYICMYSYEDHQGSQAAAAYVRVSECMYVCVHNDTFMYIHMHTYEDRRESQEVAA